MSDLRSPWPLMDLPPVVREFLQFYMKRGTSYGQMNRRYLKMLLKYVELMDTVTSLENAMRSEEDRMEAHKELENVRRRKAAR